MNNLFKFNNKISFNNRKRFSNNVCTYNLILGITMCLASFGMYKYLENKQELKDEGTAYARSRYELYFDKL